MKKTILLNIFILLGFVLNAQTLPDNWTGDSGIDTYKESTTVYGGSYSCRIDVNTGNQSSCDLSNDVTIPITAGDTYTISFWAYTSDHVRITGVLDWDDGNSKYSGVYVGPATGGWAQFTYSGTVPAGVTGVNLRLRSYDVSGFVAPETQYVDDITFESPTGTSLTVTNGDMESWPTVSAPTKLVITSVNSGLPPHVNTAFDVVVQAQDNSNTPQNVSSDVNITLSLETGTGTLSGTLTGTILSGTNSVTVSGVLYDTEETGVSITATDNSGGLASGTSTLFEVIGGPITISTLADLRAGTIGYDYTLSGEVILTYQQTYRHQKYIEDATAAILIDDNSGVITTTYNIGDGITGITGTLGEYGNMLQFIPTADPGTATSTGNTITPQEVTINELFTNFENYEAELVKIMDATFTDAGGTFATGTVYAITDASKASGEFRTSFYSADYIGQTIPGTVNITGLPNSRTTGNYITSRSSADFEVAGLPTIENAFSISSTAVDVYYTTVVPSVDPGDYYITGTANIVFSGAVIDGTNPQLVHLTGANPAMVSDLTVDELFDDAYGTSYSFYAGISPVSYLNTNNTAGTLIDSITATFQGIVSANDGYNNVWFSSASGQYNGVMIYKYGFDGLVSVGDEIIVSGKRLDHYGLTELTNPVLVLTVSTGNTPYGPDIISGSDIEYTIASNTNPAEAWEGQLVKIEDFTVDSVGISNYFYWCSVDISGTTYTFVVGDNVDYHLNNISLTVGVTYTSVTGVVDWNNSGPYYRINPRGQSDIGAAVTNPATQLAVVSVNEGIDPYTSTDFSVVVQSWDDSGNPAVVTSDINFTFTTNGGTSGNVDFVSGTTVTGVINAGATEATVTGVQMTPAGTGVTITANDDNAFNGLSPGTSAVFDVVDFSLPEIIITEIMQNPSDVSDADGEWFEVYNNGATDVDMNGWTIKDNGTNSHTISSSFVVPAHGFATLGIKSDQAINGGYTCDYQYSNFTLGNGDDEVILVLPDGVTEVDRVEYDGGAVWPDPTGASMVYTGFPNEDNNDGTKWVWASFRESTYPSATGTDKGSPGTEGYDQILSGGFKLDLKVYLEGPFNTANDSMDNSLRAAGLLPLMQPFNPSLPYYGNNNPAWLYSGTEEVSYIQWPVVDWVLIELRDATTPNNAGPGTMVAQYPAFVNQDGSVVSLNGHTMLNVKQSITNNMYIVIWHRNHLGIMSSVGFNPADGDTISYDFSTGLGQVYGGTGGYKLLNTGIWGMVVGDINADKTIDATDVDNAWAPDAGDAGYKAGDLNFNGEVNNIDKNDFWFINYNTNSSVPN